MTASVKSLSMLCDASRMCFGGGCVISSSAICRLFGSWASTEIADWSACEQNSCRIADHPVDDVPRHCCSSPFSPCSVTRGHPKQGTDAPQMTLSVCREYGISALACTPARPPGKKLSFFLKIPEKKKLKKSFSTDKFEPNGQLF